MPPCSAGPIYIEISKIPESTFGITSSTLPITVPPIYIWKPNFLVFRSRRSLFRGPTSRFERPRHLLESRSCLYQNPSFTIRAPKYYSWIKNDLYNIIMQDMPNPCLPMGRLSWLYVWHHQLHVCAPALYLKSQYVCLNDALELPMCIFEKHDILLFRTRWSIFGSRALFGGARVWKPADPILKTFSDSSYFETPMSILWINWHMSGWDPITYLWDAQHKFIIPDPHGQSPKLYIWNPRLYVWIPTLSYIWTVDVDRLVGSQIPLRWLLWSSSVGKGCWQEDLQSRQRPT